MAVGLAMIFPNERELQRFTGWFSDGGGEYEYLENAEHQLAAFRYYQKGVSFPLFPANVDPTTLELIEVIVAIESEV